MDEDPLVNPTLSWKGHLPTTATELVFDFEFFGSDIPGSWGELDSFVVDLHPFPVSYSPLTQLDEDFLEVTSDEVKNSQCASLETVSGITSIDVTAEDTSLPADGSSTSTVTVKTLDESGNPIAVDDIADITLELSSGSGSISELSGADGTYTVEVKVIAKESGVKTVTVTAQDTVGNKAVLDVSIEVIATTIPDQNAIAVLDTPQMIKFLTSYIEKIDAPTPQVMISATLLEITRGNKKDLGLEFGASKERTVLDVADGVGLVFKSLKEVPEAFDMSLQAMLSEDKARILASPRVAVLSGQTAVIDVGVKYMFQTSIYSGYGYPLESYTSSSSETKQSIRRSERYPQEPWQYPSSSYYSRRGFNTIDTGISLDITPWVGNAGEITMTIAPTIRDADEVASESARIADRSLDTVIRVNDGGMIIIGGLIQEKELTKEDKLPLLGEILLLGRLFTKSHKVKNESELVIVIKPRIIKSVMEKTEEDTD